MTALGQVLIVMSVLAGGIIYGTDVFSAIVLRPALALERYSEPVIWSNPAHSSNI